MEIKKLFENVVDEKALKNINPLTDIKAIKINSKNVERGDAFICLKGQYFDGEKFAYEAVENGASVVVCEHDIGLENQIIVDDTRKAFALICKNFSEKACDKMKIIALTGTNGKTTTAYLIANILSSLGEKVGYIGTLGAIYGGRTIDVGLTTPDPDILHQIFKNMSDSGIKCVVMEASAHAIALKKLEGINFDCAVLTNITEDHLDYFKTMDNYARTKLSFFDESHCKFGIICADDEYARSLISYNSTFMPNIPILSYGIDNPSDCFAVDIKNTKVGSEFVVNCVDEIARIKSNFKGKYNVQNMLAAISVCMVQGFSLNQIATSIEKAYPAQGRFNVIDGGDFNIVVDYAHTPDGLKNILMVAKEITDNKLITVFGCGGNRDKLKRPIMGEIACKLSDHVILTSDNPRFENPRQIISEIEEGCAKNYEVCVDRAKAIEKGLTICKSGDTLVIAGKGCEKYQEINGNKIHFDDFEQVYKCLDMRKHIKSEHEES